MTIPCIVSDFCPPQLEMIKFHVIFQNSKYFCVNLPDSHCISKQLLIFITHAFKARPAYTNYDSLNLSSHHIGAGNYYSEEDRSVPCMTFDLVLR